VKENEKNLMIEAELPGIEQDGISISVLDSKLTISGERRHEKKEENERFHRVERHYGKFQRTIPLPLDVDVNSITAQFNNGVLHVTIPKPTPPPPPSSITIPIQSTSSSSSSS